MTVPGHVFAVARLPSATAANMLNALSVPTIWTGDATGVQTHWLPFDPSLEGGAIGMLADSTLQHFLDRQFQLLDV
jgi:hypothetical protein